MGAATLGYTEGTGQDVSVDEVDMGAGPAAVQHMKIVDATDGGNEPVIAEEGYGLRVHRTRRILWEQVIPTLDTSGAYTAGDTLFEPVEITAVVDSLMGGGSMEVVVVADAAVQNAGFDLYLMNAQPSGLYAANAAFGPTAGDLALVAGIVSFTSGDYTTEGVAQHIGSIPFWIQAGLASLWAVAVTRDTPTYITAADLTLNFTFQAD
jgi:hypothetical protein